MTYRRLILPLLMLTACSAAAQLDSELSSQTRNVRVRVAFSNGGVCDAQTHVLLMSSTGVPAGEAYADSDCAVQFVNVLDGSYHLVVSGEGVEGSGSENFEVGSRANQELEVRVNRPAGPERETRTGPNAPLVAAADFNIPASARKEFDRANQFIARQNWKKAMEQLQRATAIYPRYAQAFNNLGVVYAHLGDRKQERAALQRAIDLNSHLAPAYVNLARMDIADHNFAQAESLLDTAAAIDPTDTMTLILLANMELINLHYEQTIATCRRAHSMPQAQHALVHFIAARALEQQHRTQDAMAELQVFLTEEQAGPRAEAVRREVASLQATR